MKRLLLFIATLLLTAISLHAQTTYYVTVNGAGSKNGSSWDNAYPGTSLQTAINNAAAGSSILVGAGSYNTYTMNNYQPFELKAGVKMYGGYPANGGDRNTAADTTVLTSTQLPSVTLKNYHILISSDGGQGTVLDGFEIENPGPENYADPFFPDADSTRINGTWIQNYAGGGLYIVNSSPVISGCTFANNTTSNGGAMFIISNGGAAAPQITGCTFTNNTAEDITAAVGTPTSGNGSGGAIQIMGASPVITGCTFTGNTAYGISNGMGGAISAMGATPVITGCTFKNNKAYGSLGVGGALFNSYSAPVIRKCVFTGNNAYGFNGSNGADGTKSSTSGSNGTPGGSGFGGCMYNSQSVVEIDACYVYQNKAYGGGGGNGGNGYDKGGNGGEAGAGGIGVGGAIYDIYSATGITNTLMADNSVATGGNGTGGLTYTKVQGSSSSWWDTPSNDPFAHGPGLLSLFGDSPLNKLAVTIVAAAVTTILTAGAGSESLVAAITPFAVRGGTLIASSTLAGTAIATGSLSLGSLGGYLFTGISGTTGSSTTTSTNNATPNAVNFSTGSNMYIASSGVNMDNCTVYDETTPYIAHATYSSTGVDGLTFSVQNGDTYEFNPTIAVTDATTDTTQPFELDISNSIVDAPNSAGVALTASGGSYHFKNSILSFCSADMQGANILNGSRPSGTYTISTDFTMNPDTSITLHEEGNIAGILPSNLTVNLNNSNLSGSSLLGSFSYRNVKAESIFSPSDDTVNFANVAYPAGYDSIWGTADDGFRLLQGSPGINAGRYVKYPATAVQGVKANALLHTQSLAAAADTTVTDTILTLTPVTIIPTTTLTLNTDPTTLLPGNTITFNPINQNTPTQNAPLQINSTDTSLPSYDAGDITGSNRLQGLTVDMGAYETPYYNDMSKILYVDSSIAKPGDGSSWSSAFKTLADALACAKANGVDSVIMVAKGTYYPTGGDTSVNRDSTFLVPYPLAIYGGYPSGGGNRDVTANSTILSGDIGIKGDSTDNSYHVMAVDNAGYFAGNALLDGLTFSGGNADGTGYTVVYSDQTNSNDTLYRNMGGGLLTKSHGDDNFRNTVHFEMGLVISNCTFTHNHAIRGGGMLYGSSPYVTTSSISNCTFADNYADSTGGGLDIEFTSNRHSIVGCTFMNNTAGVYGGGIYCAAGAPGLTNVLIARDSAGIAGGGLYHEKGGDIGFANCTVTGNKAGGNATGGGIALNNNGTDDNGNSSGAIIYNSILYYNTDKSGESDVATVNNPYIYGLTSDIGGNNPSTSQFVNKAPQFTDSAAGNYTLAPPARCLMRAPTV